MFDSLPILMYHYVRPPEKWFSNKHKALDTAQFLNQLDVLKQDFYFVDGRTIRDLDRFENKVKNPVWLTFDDGYSDHFDDVFPALLANKALGSFFIPTKAVFERKLLDVNKVHILLSLDMSLTQLIEHIEEIFNANSGGDLFGQAFCDLRDQMSVANLLNDADTRFIKILLQQLLPHDLRKVVIDCLFNEHVRRDESSFVDELYMTPDHVKTMFEAGMNIGSHGHEHSRYEYMNSESQKVDFELSINYLKSVNVYDSHLVFCYPYGSIDDNIKDIIRCLGCEVAVSIKPGIVDLSAEYIDWLELKRIDAKFFDSHF